MPISKKREKFIKLDFNKISREIVRHIQGFEMNA